MKFDTVTPEIFLPNEEVSAKQLKIRLTYFKKGGGVDNPRKSVEELQEFLDEWKQKELYKKLNPVLSWDDFCKVELNLTPQQIEAMDVVKAHDLAELESILIRLTNKLIDKLDDPNLKLNLPNVTDKSQDILSCDNMITSKHRGTAENYIMSRLKRDAELGDEKAKDVEKKVRKGVFTSARQVALEMGYRKPIEQKCLPMDVEKAVDKIIKQMGVAYADELSTALYQRLLTLSQGNQNEYYRDIRKSNY